MSALQQAISHYDAGELGAAEAVCRTYLRVAPTDLQALHLLANLHARRGNDHLAIQFLTDAHCYAADDVGIACDLAAAYARLECWEEVVLLLEGALRQHPQSVRACGPLAQAYCALGRRADAQATLMQCCGQNGPHTEITHLLAAISGTPPSERCTTAFVEEHFDRLAATFDSRLVQDLRYRGPAIVQAALSSHLPPSGRFRSILDAGCGTGLCGPVMRPMSHVLHGVDLSSRMIALAKTRQCYDHLAVSELCLFMDSRPAAFAAVVFADVLIYFGTLEAPLRAARTALEPDGLLIATFETSLQPEPYRLASHGRYVHAPSYLRSTFADSGFNLIELLHVVLRHETRKPVRGLLAVARR